MNRSTLIPHTCGLLSLNLSCENGILISTDHPSLSI
jgi:hypothetical protein